MWSSVAVIARLSSSNLMTPGDSVDILEILATREAALSILNNKDCV